MVGKLHTKRSFNKEAFMGTMKTIWKLNNEVEITAIEDNFFIFKFQASKDNERILEGSIWFSTNTC
ncbi:hypothetical protein PTKIN_Ptkin07bG0277500 [Pterospermum kingtungense]